MPSAGQRILAQDFTESVQASNGTGQTNIASSTPATGTPTVDLTFTAPTSGKVAITVGGRMADDSGSGAIIFDYQVYLGTSASGTLILDTANADRRLELRGDSSTRNQNASKTSLITGLTAGAVYYVRMMHYRPTGTDTADIVNRQIMVVPLPA